MNANIDVLHHFSTQRRNKCLSKAAIFVFCDQQFRRSMLCCRWTSYSYIWWMLNSWIYIYIISKSFKLQKIASGISFTYSKSNSGLRTEHWGTPLLILIQSEHTPLITTLCCLCGIKLANHLNRLPHIP